jgi:rhodanese-related sulfurtransferase
MISALTPQEVQQALNSDRPVAVIDIREPLMYSDGHISESTLVPRRLLELRLPVVVPNENATLIICDQSGEQACSDASWLAALGYDDVSYLAGGMDAWVAAGFNTIERQNGVYGTAFNYPSKEFGERVQVTRQIKQIQPDELRALLDADDEDVVVTDVRTPAEYHDNTIPGAYSVEGVDLGLYVECLRDSDQTLVVNCAGRTRSIIGAATLDVLGFEDVYELENGTMGWELAGHSLEAGAARHVRGLDVSEESRANLRTRVDGLLDVEGVSRLSIDEFQALVNDPKEVVYIIDVRTQGEYEAEHVPGSISVPGGQAIQTADEHIAVRNGTIVFVSDSRIRAGITAYWFAEMGYPVVTVLDGGLDEWKTAGLPLETGASQTTPLQWEAVAETASYVSVEELVTALESGTSVVLDVGTSTHYEVGHVPSATWVPRYHIEQWLDDRLDSDEPVVLTCPDGQVSTYTAAALQHERDGDEIRVLRGGVDAWADADRSLADGSDGMAYEPRDVVPKPYHQGEWAKRAYLDWEQKLGEQFTRESAQSDE